MASACETLYQKATNNLGNIQVAKSFRSTSCAIGWNAKSNDADIALGRIVIKRGSGVALNIGAEQEDLGQ
jgi:hypothetical protein